VNVPRPGLTIPVSIVRVIDGDTIVVKSRLTGRKIHARLADCSTPELSTPRGQEAKTFLNRLFSEYDAEILCHWDWPTDKDGNGIIDLDEILMAWTTFERTPCVLFIDGVSLCEILAKENLLNE
jgi:hypothetical protein